MRTTLFLISGLLLASSTHGDDRFDLKLDANWRRTSAPQPQARWSWQTWRSERGDLLTIATNSIARKLTSYGDLDRAMDFASSAYPEWLNTTAFPSWSNDEHDFAPRFLKLKSESTRGKRDGDEQLPIVSYVMVNDHQEHSFMAVGAVVCIGQCTYYIQHNSKRPISDETVKATLSQVVSQAGSVSER